MRLLKESIKPPSIGVLVSSRSIANLRKQRPSTHQSIMSRAIEIVRAELYFFSTASVDDRRGNIDGVYWDSKTGQWRKKSFRLPNILYIRGGGDQEVIERLVSKIKKAGIVINYPRFDKWTVHQCLARYKSVQDNIPDTVIYKSERDIRAMLVQYGDVYLKPVRGRKGRGVIRVKQKGERYSLSYYVDRGPHSGLRLFELPDIDSVLTFASRIYNNNNFLVQQAIDLVKVDDRLVDLRAEMLRNTSGKLDIIAITARIGGSKSPITTHSRAVTLDHFLTQICGYNNEDSIRVEEDIRQFLSTIYKLIEVHYGRYGEIGIDFGLDGEGRIWFIECNSQSAKVSLAKAYGYEAVYKSFLEVLGYGKYAFRRQQRVRSVAKRV